MSGCGCSGCAPEECLPGERRRALRARQLNGIESVRVDAAARTLQVNLLGKLAAEPTLAGLRIEPVGPATTPGRGRVAVTAAAVRARHRPEATRPDRIDVVLDRLGDRGGYVVRLLGPEGFDPRYGSAEFTFVADCPGAPACPAGPPARCPDPAGAGSQRRLGDYLAKDYASFRQLVLDRLALVSPDWADRQVPDLGVMLVELFSYVADHLSYTQDAVATEAYLGTARLRTSIRRHLRLVGYRLHDGCNARAWVALEVLDAGVIPAGSFRFATAVPQLAGVPVVEAGRLQAADPPSYEVFEPVAAADVEVRPAHNTIRFWTWGGQECVLAAGSTSATVIDTGPRELALAPGDVLIVEEVRGPRTGVPGDADPAHRQAVRLTAVEPTEDPVYEQALLRISWDPADALTFDACLSAVTGPDCCLVPDVTVARGNVVLADHGRTEPWCRGGPQVLVAPPATAEPVCCEGPGDPVVRTVADGFSPVLAPPGLTRAAPFPDPAVVAAAQARVLDRLIADLLDDPLPATSSADVTRLHRRAARAHSGLPTAHRAATDLGPAASALVQDPRSALVQLGLTSGDETWRVRADLLDSGPDDPDGVAEVDDEDRTHLRFGDGVLGRAVDPGQRFEAVVRIGNGAAGNVAAGAIAHLVSCGPFAVAVASVRNPVAAVGGTDPEATAPARLLGPTAVRHEPLARAVIADDYATVTRNLPGVQDAAADLAWNGSWYEAQAAIDPAGGTAVPPALLRHVDARLHQVRRIGHDVQACEPDRIGVDVTMQVCLLQGAEWDLLRARLEQVLGAGRGPDGALGLLHPDRLRFGSEVPMSTFVAAAMAVPGVRSATVSALRRSPGALAQVPADGVLRFGPLELPVAGVLTLHLVNAPSNRRSTRHG